MTKTLDSTTRPCCEFGTDYEHMHINTLKHIELRLVDCIMSTPSILNKTERDRLLTYYQNELREVVEARKTKEV